MILNSKKKYQEYLNELEVILNQVNITLEQTKQAKDIVENTELIIPVLGTFSAGKSSLLNAFMGNDYLSVGVTPETALATELHYSTEDDEYIETVDAKEKTARYAYTKENMLQIKDKAKSLRYIKAFLKNEKLREINPLIIVDMPGFDSPLDEHSIAISNYISRAAHYIILINVLDGTIAKSVERHLLYLLNLNRSFSFFLSKTNLKSPEDIRQTLEEMSQQLEAIGIEKNIIPIDDRGGENLKKVIQEINPDDLFKQILTPHLQENHNKTQENIKTTISTLEKDDKKVEDALKEIERALDNVIKRRDIIIQEAKAEYATRDIRKITNTVESELKNSSQEIIHAALNGGQSSFINIINGIIKQVMTQELMLLIKKVGKEVTEKIVDDTKELDNILSDFAMGDNQSWIDDFSKTTQKFFEDGLSGINNIIDKRRGNENINNTLYKTITTILALTTTVLTPVLEVIIVFLPEVIGYVFKNAQKKKQEREIKELLHTNVIPQIKRKLMTAIPPLLGEQVERVTKDISEKFETEIQRKKESINKAKAEKKDKEENNKERINQLKDAQNQIEDLAKSVIF